MRSFSVLFVAVVSAVSAAAGPTVPSRPVVEKPIVAPAAQIIRPGDIFITRFDPPKLPAGGNRKVTIYGGGFTSCQSFRVLFTGASGAQDKLATPSATIGTAIDLTGVPGGAQTGKVAFECSNPKKTVLSPVDFQVPTDITVTGVKPATAPRGSRITIYGTGFNQWDNFEVRFAVKQPGLWSPQDLIAPSAKRLSDTSLEVVVPKPASTGMLQVWGRLQSDPTASSFRQSTFALTVPVPLVVSGFVSPQALPGRGAVLRGSGFLIEAEIAAYFTGSGGQTTEAAAIQPGTRSDSELTLTVPSGARTGPVRLVVGTGAATQSATTAASFRVLGAMQIADVQPRSGLRGSTVTISGSGFLNRSVVSVEFWNGQDVSNQSATVATKSDDTLTVLVPDGARGTGKVQVISGVGSDFETVNSTQDFTLLPDALALTDVQPRSARPGASVTISGQFRDYMGLTVVFPDASGAATQGAALVSRAATSLVVAVPSGSAGTGKVGVVGVLGPGTVGYPRTDRATSAQDFTVVRDPVQITGFSPPSGPANSRVVISGQNFQNPYSLDVFFPAGGSTLKAPLVTRTDSALTVAVPAGATGAGKIVVVVGPERVQSAQDFQVTP